MDMGQAAVPPPAGPQVQSVQQVLDTVNGVLSIEAGVRSSCEALLRAWEADAVPGFLSSLMQIVEQVGAVEEPIRLLAAVVAKNAVGSSWRKTLGTREWSRVPLEEQQAVRDGAARLLLADPSDRVAMQLSLLLANIARFDFPGRAPDLLAQLVQAAQWPASPDPPSPMHLRALKALHHVLVGLTTKRFVVEAPRVTAPPMLMDLRAAGQAIAQERELYSQRLNQLAGPLTQLFMAHAQAFLGAVPQWPHHAAAAKAAATCLADRLQLTPQADKLPEQAEELLRACHSTLAAIITGPPAGSLEPAGAALWQDLGGKVYERVCRVVIGHLDSCPIAFAPFVAPFLQLFVGGALLATDADTIHRMRPKRRVLLVRFIAKALLSPFYRSEWTQAPFPPALHPEQREQLLANRTKAAAAQISLESMLGARSRGAAPGAPPPQQCAMLTEAVISKYVALTPEELREWQEDAESYARSMEVESGPDAETPRPIGVGLLLCMLERGGEPVVKALLSLAGRTQALPGPDAALLREATYRCIGEGFSHVSPHITFSAWYTQELEPMLSSRLPLFIAGNPPDGVIGSVLQARALWLVGVCSAELQLDQWGSAFRLASGHMGAVDVVVALSAVSSCLAMCAPLLDDQSLVERADAAARRANKGSGAVLGASGLVAALHLSEQPAEAREGEPELEDEQQALLNITRQRIEVRLTAVCDAAASALQAAFSLLSRLSEVESMVRVLQLVSIMVEVMDDRVRPHLPIIAAALPKIWEAAAEHTVSAQHAAQAGASLLASAGGKKEAKSGDTGAVVRLHSALLAVLTHLVGKLKSNALADPQVSQVVYPLLRYATSLNSQESECLVDEAFRLWSCTLSALPEVPQPVLDLLPNLAALIKRGRDAPQAFPLVEAYLLLGAAPHVIPMLELIQGAMIRCVHNVEQAALASVLPAADAKNPAGPPGLPAAAGGPPGAARAFSVESAAEALATSALADVMLQLSPSEVPSMLASTFSAMVHFVCHPQLPALDCDARLVNCLEGFLEVLARVFLVHPPSFASLLASAASSGPPVGNTAAAAQATPTDIDTLTSLFIDKWLTIASHSYIEESLGVKTMAMLGRYRRRIAASALCALMAAGAFPRVLLDAPAQIARVAALAVRVQMDDSDFHADQSELDSLDFKGDLAEDRVLAKRLNITRSDPVRSLKVHEAVRSLLHGLAAALGSIDNLLTLLSAHASPRLAHHANAIISGNLAPLFEDNEDDPRNLDGVDDDDDAFGEPGPRGTLTDLSE